MLRISIFHLVLTVFLQVRAADGQMVRQLFAHPPREFSSAPLWVWNDLISEDQIVLTLHDLAQQQVKQVFVHPRPGLMTPYLSEDWFRLWRVALREAEQLDMNIWIYDENSYPSGFAGGYVPDAMPQARGRGLVFREVTSVPNWDASTLGIFRLGAAAPENVSEAARAGRRLSEGRHYLVASVQRAADSPWHGNRCYVDLLYPGVTEKFLDITLGAYQRELGSQFGKRIPGIFTDEPNIRPAGGWPWTEDLPEQFQKRWGYDLLESLPSLQFETGDWRRVRHNYFALLNDLFIRRWAKPYAERAAKLGLEMTGHYWEHDWPDCTGVPDNMAMYAFPQRPAIDCLMNQYAEHTHAQFGNIRSVRELGSIANQLGKARTLCEVYGAGGWDLRFEDMKRQADWLGVLGVNTFDQHLSYLTIRGARKRDHPQSFSYHEPWWDAYHICGEYLERLSVAVSQGQQVNEILVLEPTSTAWMYQGNESALKELGQTFFELLKMLESDQDEYDLGCEDVIARHGSVQGRSLVIGQRAYHTVVLPPLLENLNAPTWDLLNEFIAGGGSIISCKPLRPFLPRRDGELAPNPAAPAGFNARWERIDCEHLSELLSQRSANSFQITRAPGDRGILFHMRRQLADGELLLLVNTSSEHSSRGHFRSKARGAEQWVLETGSIKPYNVRPQPSGITADYELPPCGSLLLFLSNGPVSPLNGPRELITAVAAAGPVEVTRTRPNVLVLDYVDVAAGGETRTNLYFYQANQFAFAKNGMGRNPWDSAVQFKDELIKLQFPPESGFTATYRFQIEEAVPNSLAVVVERPDLYRITCNGKLLIPTSDAWWLDRSFGRLEIASLAKVGENEITLRAAPFTLFHELESIYILGDFTLRPKEHGFELRPEVPLQLGRWNEQGAPFYSAGVTYRQVFDVGKKAGDRFQVKLGSWFGSVAKVTVNGRPSGWIAYPPYEREVTDQIQSGRNMIEITVVGTLKNTLGPHHGHPALGSAWPGMFQKAPSNGPPPGIGYDTVGYGLFSPFTLQQSQ